MFAAALANLYPFFAGIVAGVLLATAPGIVKAVMSNRALRKRLGLAMKPEYMETRQLRRQYGRGFARGAVKLAKEMERQRKLPFRERLRLWRKHNFPTFIWLIGSLTKMIQRGRSFFRSSSTA